MEGVNGRLTDKRVTGLGEWIERLWDMKSRSSKSLACADNQSHGTEPERIYGGTRTIGESLPCRSMTVGRMRWKRSNGTGKVLSERVSECEMQKRSWLQDVKAMESAEQI